MRVFKEHDWNSNSALRLFKQGRKKIEKKVKKIKGKKNSKKKRRKRNDTKKHRKKHRGNKKKCSKERKKNSSGSWESFFKGELGSRVHNERVWFKEFWSYATRKGKGRNRSLQLLSVVHESCIIFRHEWVTN